MTTGTKKIVFVGNTNNYPHLLARCLASLGHDVTHVIDRSEPLHQPRNKFDDASSSTSRGVRLLNIGHIDFRDVFRSNPHWLGFQDILRNADLVIVNGLGPAILHVTHRSLVVLLTGSDLTFVRDWRRLGRLERDVERGIVGYVSWGMWRLHYLLHAWVVRRRQIRIIRRAHCVSYFPPGVVPEGDQLLAKIGIRGHRLALRLADIPSSHASVQSAGLPLRIINLGRISWVKRDSDARTALDFKGTELLLKGIAAARDLGFESVRLTLFRKGPDLTETGELIEHLGIGDLVSWHDEVSQRDLKSLVQRAHIVVDNLGPSSPGMATMDSLALGRAVITNGQPTEVEHDLLKGAPLLHAASVDDVREWIVKLISDPSLIRTYGEASRRFAIENLSVSRQAEEMLNMLDTTPSCGHR